MDQPPDQLAGIIAAITGTVVGVVVAFKKFSWRLFEPPKTITSRLDKIDETLSTMAKAINDVVLVSAKMEERFEERFKALADRVGALERK